MNKFVENLLGIQVNKTAAEFVVDIAKRHGKLLLKSNKKGSDDVVNIEAVKDIIYALNCLTETK
jgi:hypothetical protein